MKTIVTGAAGFIPSHLVDRLLADGHEVIGIDSMVTGFDDNIADALKNPKFEIIKKDLKQCEKSKFEGVDMIFHMAAYPIRMKKLYDYKTYYKQTEGGALAALEIARRNDIKLFVLPASTTLYGQAKQVPTPEEFIGPDSSFYGTAKFNTERWAEAYSGLFGLDVLITRFGRIQGPRSRNGAAWELVKKIEKNPKRLQVLGNGQQTRSFVHVKDCVEGMMVSMRNRKGKVDRFNIANDDTATIKDMVDILLEEANLTGKTKVAYQDEPVGWKGDNVIVFPDISKLKSCGWRPTMNSKETLRDCIRWTLKEVRAGSR
jgi:UDP-glucose 4-epimerase